MSLIEGQLLTGALTLQSPGHSDWQGCAVRLCLLILCWEQNVLTVRGEQYAVQYAIASLVTRHKIYLFVPKGTILE